MLEPDAVSCKAIEADEIIPGTHRRAYEDFPEFLRQYGHLGGRSFIPTRYQERLMQELEDAEAIEAEARDA